MKRILILWRLELKRMMKLLPAMSLEAILLLAILSAISFGIVKILYQDSPTVQIKIAVIEEEGNPLTDLLLDYVQGMESISELCQFLMVSEEEGLSMMQEGKVAAVLVLPGNMVEGILDGSNVPVQVYFPENAGLESALLKELTDAGVRMLCVAQAEIYGIYDTAKNYGALENLSVLETEIDRYNLAFALDRLALFQIEEVSATGRLSFLQYGIASGLIYFLLLLGMACYPMMQPYSAVLQKQLVRQEVGIGLQCFGKWLCGVCCMGIGGFCFWLVAKGILSALGHAAWMPGINGRKGCIFSLIIILLCTATFVYLLFQLAANGLAAILLLFFLSTVMVYCSGGFLPSVFLPETVQQLGKFLPTTYLIEAAGSLYVGEIPGKAAGILILFTILFGIAAYGTCKVRKGAGT